MALKEMLEATKAGRPAFFAFEALLDPVDRQTVINLLERALSCSPQRQLWATLESLPLDDAKRVFNAAIIKSRSAA